MSTEMITSEQAIRTKRYKFLLAIRYFETGRAKLNYAQYLIAFYALASQDVIITMIVGIAYAFGCFIFGLWWYKSHTILIERELDNQFNLFVRELRRKINITEKHN